MIDYFPKILPDEWIYSAVCRYANMRGEIGSEAIKQELSGTGTAHLGTLFPNKYLALLVKQLPSSVFSFEDILLNHTLFKYFVRFYPLEEKKYLMKYLSEAGSPQLTHLWRSYGRKNWQLRYCPCCVKEDEEQYGTAYYHLSHQIPLVSVCQKHNCKLKHINTGNTKISLNSRFYALGEQDVDTDADYDVLPNEIMIATVALSHLELPLDIGPTSQFNNLMQELFNGGFYRISRKDGVVIDCDKLRYALIEKYGDELIEQVFGPTINMGIMLRIRRFEQLLPDRYILLQGLIGMSTETLFSEYQAADNLWDKMINASMNNHGSARKVASDIGIKEYELYALCQQYGIEPFWSGIARGKVNAEQMRKLSCSVPVSEYERLKQETKRNGYKRIIDYLLGCEKSIHKEENNEHI